MNCAFSPSHSAFHIPCHLHSVFTAPYSVRLCTPIDHPNVFGGWICLSMLRPHTGSVPYEGWSGAYSATSVLMQLQSFLFADNIDQDEGYAVKALTSACHVNRSLKTLREFKCEKCSHSHATPWPATKATARSIIKLQPVDYSVDHVVVENTSCHSKQTYDEYQQTKGTMICQGASLNVNY